MKNEKTNRGVKAIIVDDDQSVLFLHELMVQESGFSNLILTFNNAEEALTHLGEGQADSQPTIVFLDINMPRMNGWDFLNHLEKSGLFVGVFVVMVTSSINRADREKARSFRHVVDFVEKPLNMETCDRLKMLDHIQHLFTET